jgi:hypothetical protein
MFFQPPFHISRFENDQIHRETSGNITPDLERLIDLVACGHYDQDVDIAIGVGNPVGVGAEQNDLVRLEVLGDLACETADDAHGNIGAAIPAGGPTIGSSPGLGSAVWKSPAFGFHALIVPGAQAGCYAFTGMLSGSFAVRVSHSHAGLPEPGAVTLSSLRPDRHEAPLF